MESRCHAGLDSLRLVLRWVLHSCRTGAGCGQRTLLCVSGNVLSGSLGILSAGWLTSPTNTDPENEDNAAMPPCESPSDVTPTFGQTFIYKSQATQWVRTTVEHQFQLVQDPSWRLATTRSGNPVSFPPPGTYHCGGLQEREGKSLSNPLAYLISVS